MNAILSAAGWSNITAHEIDYYGRTGEGVDPIGDSLTFFQRIGPMAPVLRAMESPERAAALARIAEVCKVHLNGQAVEFPAAAWIWSARA